MTKRTITLLLSATVLLTATACGGGTKAVIGTGSPTVDSITGSPFVTVVATPFTVIGNNFESLAGPNVTVRFTAVGGVTPFAGGTSDFADVPGTVIDNMTVDGTTPSFVYPGAFDATVTVIMPNLAQGVSASPIAQFIGLQITGFAPPNLPSDAQDPFTVAGSGFAPVGNTATVTFIADAGTPFLGGTTDTLVVVGTVDSDSQISGVAPIAGVNIPAAAFVMVTLDNAPGAPSATSLTPLVTFDPPTVDSAAPLTVPSEIPTAVTITGTGFGPVAGVAQVRLSADAGTPFLNGTVGFIDVLGTITSATTIDFVTTAFTTAVDVPTVVGITLPSGAGGVSALPILTVLTPTVDSVDLSNVPSEIPTFLTITGTGFAPNASNPTIRFTAAAGTPFLNGTAAFMDVVGTVINSTTITCTTPRAGISAATAANITAFLTGGLAPTSAAALITFDPPTVASAAPTSVESEIPQVVTLTGTGFGSATGNCNVTLSGAGTPFTLGTQPSLTVLGTIVNPTTITFTSPIAGVLADVNADVSLTFPTGASATAAALLLIRTPTVTASSLGAVPSEIPTVITITGTGFAGGTPTVRFANATSPFLGGTASSIDATGVTLVNSTTITCTTPRAGTSVNAGTTVRVLLTGGLSPVSAGPLVTFLAPTIASVSPTSVESEIPQVVTITGTGFSSASGNCNVTLSGAGTPFSLGTQPSLTVLGTIVNPTTITFTSPISGVQSDLNADVSLTFPTGASATSAGLLLIRTPTVTASSLATVPSEIPTVITITGSGFAGGTPTVRFANGSAPFLGGTVATIDATGVTLVNATTITCTTPRAGTTVDAAATIQVLLTGGLNPISTGALVTFLAPTIASASPISVESEIPQVVTLTGTGFGSASGNCNVTLSGAGTPFTLGTQPSLTVTGTIVNPTTITFTSPICGLQSDLNADVTVAFITGASATSAGLLLIKTPTVTSSSLAAVDSENPTLITITGSGFAGGTPTVRFANGSAPFAGGTVATIDATGVTIVNGTTITCTTPRAGTNVNAGATIQVLLTGGLTPISTGPLVTFIAPTAVFCAPPLVDAAAATLVTVTGTGFYAPGTVTMRFTAATGTPFAGSATLDVTGATVVNPTTITATTPVLALTNKAVCSVGIIFASGAAPTTPAGCVTFEVPPVAVDDSYAADGNVELVVNTANGVINGVGTDSDPDGDALSVSAFDAASVNGGNVAVAADGSFTYNPPPGFEGVDTFTYTITDGFLTDTATVTVTVSGMVWFIDNTAAPGGDGRFTTPWDAFSDFTGTALDGVGDTIFVYSSATAYTGNAALLVSQKLLGQGVALVHPGGNSPSPLVAASTNPTIDSAAGNTITVSGNNTIRGLDIDSSAGDALRGTSVGILNIDTVNLDATGGAAINIDGTGTLATTFGTISSANASSDGIDLVGLAGAFAVTGTTTVSNATGDGINIGNSTGSFAFSGLVSLTGGANGITVTTGTAPISFVNLNITTPTDDGILINTAGGTFDVTGTCDIDTPGNSAGTPTTDHGVDINSSSTDVTFADLDINDSTGHGVELNSNSGDFICQNGLIDNCDDTGIHATTCTGKITLGTASGGPTIQESGDGAVNGQSSHGLLCDDCTGDIRVENCVFDDMNETPTGAGSGLDNNGIFIDHRSSGTLGSLQIIDCEFYGTVSAGSGTTTDHGIKIVLDNNAKITDCDVTGCLSEGLGRSFCEVNCDIDDDGDDCDIGDLNISDNGTAVNPLESQAAVIELRVDGTSTVVFHIDNNVMNDTANGHSSGNGIRLNSGEFGIGTTSTASMTGTINDNDIDGLGDGSFDNGIELQVQESTTAVIEIDSNTVDGQSDDGLRVRIFDAATCDCTISNNSVGLTTANTNEGIEVQTRSGTPSLCLDIFNNNCASSNNYELNHDAGTFDLLDIVGVVGGATPWNATEVDTYLGSSGVNRNNIGTKNTLAGTYTNCTSVSTP